MKLQDGSGRGFWVGVDNKNRLKASSIITPEITEEALEGNSFVISSGAIALTTTASFNGMLYVKNTNLRHTLYVERVSFQGTQIAQWRMHRNPTTGTLVTSGTSIDPVNLSFSSGTKLLGVVNKGANALTITDGVVLSTALTATTPLTFDLRGAFQVSENNSLAFDVKPSVAGDFCVEVHCYIKDDA